MPQNRHLNSCIPRSPGARRPRHALVISVILLAVGGLAYEPASGQQPVFGEREAPDNLAFSLHLAERPIVDEVESFRAACRDRAWEKAFRALREARKGVATALLPLGEGFHVPLRRCLHEELLALGPSGRHAFQIFHDAQARRRLDEARRVETDPARGGKLLQEVYDDFFISSVGDIAAERLGDRELESGRFVAAADYYRSLLQHHPGSDRPLARVRVKFGTALAGAGRRGEFDENLAVVENRHRAEQVVLGDESVSPVAFLRSLHVADGGARPEEHARALTIPESDEPSWEYSFPSIEEIRTKRRRRYYGVLFEQPAACVRDARQVYVNWVGTVFAISLISGNVTWKTEAISSVPRRFRNVRLVQPERNALVLADDRLVSVCTTVADRNRASARLRCYSPDSGVLLWASEDIEGLQDLDFSGGPVVQRGTIYVGASRPTIRELFLVAIDIVDGALRWELALGSAGATGNAWFGFGVGGPVPQLVEHGDRLYVLTNAGALIAVDVVDRSIDWAYTYETYSTPGSPFIRRAVSERPPAPGAFLIRGRTGFLKGRGGRALHAIDLQERKLIWKRTVASYETLAAVDSRRLYLLGGKELGAIDRESRGIAWSRMVPGGSSILTTLGGRLYYTSPRGVFEYDPETGDRLRRFRGRVGQGNGGSLLPVDGGFITVSERAIVAYGPKLGPRASGSSGAENSRTGDPVAGDQQNGKK